MDEVLAVTLQHASNRIHRTKIFSRNIAKAELPHMYSRSHCLTRMPNSAAAGQTSKLRSLIAFVQSEALSDV